MFILKHPNPSFSGVCGGVDFANGVGSTNSVDDAKRLAKGVPGLAFVPMGDASAPAKPKPEKTAAKAEGEGKPEGAAPAEGEKPKKAGGKKPK